MKEAIPRRQFMVSSAATAFTATLGRRIAASEAANPTSVVRVGVIGVGGRGTSLLQTMLRMQGVTFPAVCDIDRSHLQRAQKLVEEAGQPRPEGYDRNETVYEELTARDDLDAVIIATPWNWHAPMALSAMKAGKYAGVEVPAAQTVEECWELVRTSEKCKIPCMMLENWCYRRDNLAVLKMIRAGLLGETVHAQCAYSHDCLTYFFDEEGNTRWQGQFLKNRSCDVYPTHGLGPIMSWLNIHAGDRFETLVSAASEPFGIAYRLEKQFGPDHPNVKHRFAQGDVVTTVMKTHLGKTVVIFNDMLLPRPYDNRWLVQGTEGIYSQEHNAVYLEGKSPRSHEWEPFPPYQDAHDPLWWKNAPADILERGHGGCDYFELQGFLDAVRNKTQTPVDVYDSAAMSCVVPLSAKSMRLEVVVKVPDFTRGKWEENKPRFALDI